MATGLPRAALAAQHADDSGWTLVFFSLEPHGRTSAGRGVHGSSELSYLTSKDDCPGTMVHPSTSSGLIVLKRRSGPQNLPKAALLSELRTQ